MACDCRRITFRLDSGVDADPVRTCPVPIGYCDECKQEWHIREVKSGQALLAKSKDVKKSAKPSKLELDLQTVRQTWLELTGEQSPLEDSAIAGFFQLPADVSGLFIDAGATLLSAQMSLGRNHVAVEPSAQVQAALQSVLTHFELVDFSWRPAYGRLFKGIVIGCALGAEWLEIVKEHLDREGNICLLGSGMMHSEHLATALGLRPIIKNAGYQVLVPKQPEVPHGVGSILLDDIKATGIPSCQLCYDLAMQMNAWGAEGCREHMTEIIDGMMPRARKWWENTDWQKKTDVIWKSRRSALLFLQQAAKQDASAVAKLDAMLRTCVQTFVVDAIRKYEKNNELCLPGPGAAG